MLVSVLLSLLVAWFFGHFLFLLFRSLVACLNCFYYEQYCLLLFSFCSFLLLFSLQAFLLVTFSLWSLFLLVFRVPHIESVFLTLLFLLSVKVKLEHYKYNYYLLLNKIRSTNQRQYPTAPTCKLIKRFLKLVKCAPYTWRFNFFRIAGYWTCFTCVLKM